MFGFDGKVYWQKLGTAKGTKIFAAAYANFGVAGPKDWSKGVVDPSPFCEHKVQLTWRVVYGRVPYSGLRVKANGGTRRKLVVKGDELRPQMKMGVYRQKTF